MNDRFLRSDGRRWSSTEMQRVQRRFRHHVRTPSNPRGRIHREGCFWHPEVEAEFHHVDYANPWRGAWLGLVCGCHRKVDHGSLKLPAKAIFDYTSLIEQPGISRPGGRRAGANPDTKACHCGRRSAREVELGKHPRSGCPREPIDNNDPFNKVAL